MAYKLKMGSVMKYWDKQVKHAVFHGKETTMTMMKLSKRGKKYATTNSDGEATT